VGRAIVAGSEDAAGSRTPRAQSPHDPPPWPGVVHDYAYPCGLQARYLACKLQVSVPPTMQLQTDHPPRFEQSKEVAAGERYRKWAPNSPLSDDISLSKEQSVTDDDCLDYLVPQQPATSSSSQCVGSESFRSCCSPTASRSSEQNADTAIKSAEQWFKTALGTSAKPERVTRLAGIAHGFPCDDRSCEQLRSAWSRIFPPGQKVEAETGSIPAAKFEATVAYRLRRLSRARQNLQKHDWIARRMWQILLAHELESISLSEHIHGYTGHGVDPNSAAQKIARKYLETAKADFKCSANIVQVIKEGGPASLLAFCRTPPSM
jgi:hypothetical protein